MALAKLVYCDDTIRALGDRPPVVTQTDPDEDVGELKQPLDRYYHALEAAPLEAPPGLDAALRAIFEDLHSEDDRSTAARPAADLIRRWERTLVANVYRWTGHFPEHTRPLLRHLAERAGQLRLGYAPGREEEAIVAVTTLVTALSMNYVHRGTYMP